VIWDSVFEYEAGQPDGLNGFLLLTHVGAGPRRTEKFFDRLDELIAKLKGLGYSFVSVPVLLAEAPPMGERP
jgi:hypothetical protein